MPIVIKKPEYVGSNLNNYNEQGTDTIGLTTKTYHFNVPEDVEDAQLVLITSNHGANTNGEEYNRRWHYIYYDDALVLTYKPGRDSCEPFRQYNTQANGIYGWTAKTDAAWQSFSNWCPGDVIDNRIINLGAVEKGEHKVRISVPDARFAGQQGDIPVSLYFHGLKEGIFEASVPHIKITDPIVSVFKQGSILTLSTPEVINKIEIYNYQGEKLYLQFNGNPIDMSFIPKGLYLIHIELESGIIETHKIFI